MNIALPDWYDALFAFECESKGCVLNFEVVVDNKKRRFNFYDLHRFSQDASDEIEQYGYFRDSDAVILPKISRENIVAFLAGL